MLVRAYLLQRKFVGPVMVRRIGGRAKPGEVVDSRLVLAPLPGAAGLYKVGTKYSALYEGLAVLKRSGKQPYGLYMVARGWLAADRIDLARKRIGPLLAVEPKSRRALSLQAELAIAAKDPAALDKSLAAAEAAKVLPPADVARFYYRWGLVLRAQGKRPQALAALKKAERRAPTSAKVLRALATLSAATGQKAQARQYYARMIELFPDAADIDELRNAWKVLSAQQNTGDRK